MDDDEWTTAEEILRQRRQGIAQAWYRAISPAAAHPEGAAKVLARLRALVDQATEFLLDETQGSHVAEAMGRALAVVDSLQPEAFGCSLETVAREMLAELPAGQTMRLQPRLAKLLGGMATGYGRAAHDSVLSQAVLGVSIDITARKLSEDALREQGLRSLLEEHLDIQVVGDVADGLKALDVVERTHPDVLVLDLLLPGLSGLELIRLVRQRLPTVRIVVLSMYSNIAHVAEAMRSGAMAYVVKEEGIRELVTAVRSAAQNYHYLTPQLDQSAIDEYLERSTGVQADRYDTLTPREREVLALVTQGYTSAEIAHRWVVSRRTVESHRSHMMHKLHLKTQSDLIRFAVRRGLMGVEE